MINRQLLSDIIRPRIEEILDLTFKKRLMQGLENHIGQRVDTNWWRQPINGHG